MARRILEAGADPNWGDTRQSPLDVAAEKAHVEMVRLLLGKAARPSQGTLDRAVQSGNREVVGLIDDSLRGMAAPAKPGPDALVRAAMNSNLAGIDLALERAGWT